MFIAPPSMKVLKQRLEDRGRETAEQIEERLEAAKWELSQSTKYDCIFVNDELGECVREVRKKQCVIRFKSVTLLINY